jgi:uncharacterized protein
MIRRGNGRRCSTLAAIALVAAAVMLGIIEPARAGSMSDALAAYARGDYVAAAKQLTRFAAAGNARAQGLLGFMYEYGHGVPQDYVLAVMWYERGAEQGDPAAQYSLGLMYDKGKGLLPDVVVAHKWLILAAARAGRRERDAYIRLRDAVATKMSHAQIGLSQGLASEWVPKRERLCAAAC